MIRKYILLVAVLAMSFAAVAQNTKKVAILETVDKEGNVPYGVRLSLRGSLTYAISSTPGYEGFDRVSLSQIMDEQKFQRTGMVSNDQIKKIGEMTGCSSILVAEAAIYDATHIVITAKILNVETAGIEASTPPKIAGTDPEKMQEACNQLAERLLPKKENKLKHTLDDIVSIPGGSNQSSGAATLTFKVGNVSFDMIKVEAGSFIMGCTSEQGNDCNDGEKPAHRVTISRDFYIGKFEVTQELWQAVMGTSIYQQQSKAGSSKTYGTGADYPMYYVNWYDAQEFCAELSRITGRHFSLPTNAEWEYAARGGKKNTGAKYSGSSSVANVAWYNGNSGSRTHPVGSLRPNELGIFDMSGNVYEWCQDEYVKYPSTSQIDPVGPSSGPGRVLRGGGWNHDADDCRVSSRSGAIIEYRSDSRGFRVVLR